MFAGFRAIHSKKQKRGRRGGGKKKKEKSLQVAAQIWSGVYKGMEKEGWSEMSPENRALGKREDRERVREGAEAGAAGWLRAMLSSPDLSPH